MTDPPTIDSLARRSRRDRRGERRDLSTSGQHAVNLARIEEYGGKLGHKLTEKGVSAYKPGISRAAFDLIVSRLESGASKGVCIYDVDRLLRRLVDAQRIVDIAERGFIILEADGEYDLMTPNGRESFLSRALAAEAYSFKLSHKVKRGFTTKAKLGEGKAGRYRGFGFEPDATTVCEAEREPIRRAWYMVVREEKTWGEACAYLNGLGMPSTSGAPWHDPTLRVALTAPRMAGLVKMGGEIKGKLPGKPILKESEWQELLMLVEGRRGRKPTGTYMATGKVLCGSCGTGISGRPDRRRTYPDGEVTRLYYCKSGDRGGCGKTIGDIRALDEWLERQTLRWMADPSNAAQRRRHTVRQEELRRPHEKELARLIKLQGYWDGKLADGTCSESRHRTMMSGLEGRIATEEAKLTGLEVVSIPEEVGNARAAWEKTEPGSLGRRDLFRRTWEGFEIRVDPGPAKEIDFTGRLHFRRLHPV